MKKTVFFVAILMCSVAAAQDCKHHEFSINVGGGASSFQTRPIVGQDLWNWTATAGLGYYFFFNSHWGIGTGANIAVYNNGLSLKNYDWKQDAINTTMGGSVPFDFLTGSPHYKEPLQAMMVTIPLMLEYHGSFQESKQSVFYFAIGGKAGIPISANSLSKGNFTTKGYYPSLNVTYENIPDYGFVINQPFPENKTGFVLKNAFMASAEMGIKWRLGNKTHLYTGIYADYGINKIWENDPPSNTGLVVYQSATPDQFEYNKATGAYARQMAPLAGGITLRLAFGGCKKTKKEETKANQLDCEDKIVYITQKQGESCDCDKMALTIENAIKKAIADFEAARKEQVDDEINRKLMQLLDQQSRKMILQPIDHYIINEPLLSEARRRELDKRIKFMKDNPEVKVYVYGHTCNIGTPAANEKIGLARAQKAKEYMISQGIDERRIIGIASKRDTEPVAPNTNERNRQLNRRVEVVVVQ